MHTPLPQSSMLHHINLSKPAILAIKGLSTKEKTELSQTLGINTSTLYRWIKVSHSNVSKADVVKAIADKVGLPEDQILSQN